MIPSSSNPNLYLIISTKLSIVVVWPTLVDLTPFISVSLTPANKNKLKSIEPSFLALAKYSLTLVLKFSLSTFKVIL